MGLLSEGIESSRGRYGAYLLRDGVHGQLHPRRGSRTIAISNGGAIPDTALFNVILQPEGVQIATLDEHFAVDSVPGDVVLLGNTSWRIQRVEAAGRVLVEDAHGAPPSCRSGSARLRSGPRALDGVSELREEIAARTAQCAARGYVSRAHPEVAASMAWLKEECGVCSSAARQLIAYIVAGRAVLGAVPSKTTIIAERFFDEGGGMQLILHAPFGGRINKAWGLALRKRFCRGFNFELQAAATDNGINISSRRAAQLSALRRLPVPHREHREGTAGAGRARLAHLQDALALGREPLVCNCCACPRASASRPQIQRTRSDDLLASVFPQAAACFENIEGDIQIPDHPLVEGSDAGRAAGGDGPRRPERGAARHCESERFAAWRSIRPCLRSLPTSCINANPYAFLDDAGLEERRARAVSLRRDAARQRGRGAGRLDQAAIDTVRREIWPDIRDEHELHDLLHSLVALPLGFAGERPSAGP